MSASGQSDLSKLSTNPGQNQNGDIFCFKNDFRFAPESSRNQRRALTAALCQQETCDLAGFGQALDDTNCQIKMPR